MSAAANTKAIFTTPIRSQSNQQQSGENNQEQGGGNQQNQANTNKPKLSDQKKVRTVEGAEEQLKSITIKQQKLIKASKPDAIRSIEKSKQNSKNELKKLQGKSLKEIEDQ